MDVAAWLRGLGLEQYTSAFHDNAIDGEVLRELTADDLKDLGVTLVGHRRKLLAAIAALGTEPPIVAQSAASATSAPTSLRPVDAERRQLTVMFCDLVGSTALSTRFDPEDLRELIGDYHRAVAETVGRFDGFVAKYMGDGVLIYFGYPRAHEDDAERAVRAGLAVIEAVGRLAVKSVELQARVGIATGLVVVGDLIGEGSARSNRSSARRRISPPGCRPWPSPIRSSSLRARAGWSVISSNTAISAPSRSRASPSRYRPGRSCARAPCEPVRGIARIGADPARRARRGDRPAIAPLGTREDGRGPRRADLRRARHRQIAHHRGICGAHPRRAAYPPALFLLAASPGQRALSVYRAARPRRRVRPRRYGRGTGWRNSSLAARAGPPDDDVALFADLLSLPASERHPLPNLSPQRKKERTWRRCSASSKVWRAEQPVLMVFEDAHWIDPTSRELLDLTVERVRSLPVLLIVTFRPEFQPPWTGQPQVTMLALNRLDRRDRSALVRRSRPARH